MVMRQRYPFKISINWCKIYALLLGIKIIINWCKIYAFLLCIKIIINWCKIYMHYCWALFFKLISKGCCHLAIAFLHWTLIFMPWLQENYFAVLIYVSNGILVCPPLYWCLNISYILNCQNWFLDTAKIQML